MRIHPLAAIALLLLPLALHADDELDDETMRPPPRLPGGQLLPVDSVFALARVIEK